MDSSGYMDMILPAATISNGTGTGSLTSCIDGVCNEMMFHAGDVVQVWTRPPNPVLRGQFVVSYVEILSRRRRQRGWLRFFAPKYHEHIARIWSATALPAGTTQGDFLLVQSTGE